MSRVTDSAGVTADYIAIEDVPVGATVVGGWKPYPVVHGVERKTRDGVFYRLWFGPMFEEGSHRGEWQPAGTPVPVEVNP